MSIFRPRSNVGCVGDYVDLNLAYPVSKMVRFFFGIRVSQGMNECFSKCSPSGVKPALVWSKCAPETMPHSLQICIIPRRTASGCWGNGVLRPSPYTTGGHFQPFRLHPQRVGFGPRSFDLTWLALICFMRMGDACKPSCRGQISCHGPFQLTSVGSPIIRRNFGQCTSNLRNSPVLTVSGD